MKKRQRKDLTPDEIEEIVAATNKPYHRYEDVAQKYRITNQLVTVLVRESKKKPDAIKEQRSRIMKVQRKREAIEETVTSLLSSNKPIYSLA